MTDDFYTFEAAASALGLSEKRVGLLVGRKVLEPATDETGTRGVSKASVEAERARRAQRGFFGKLWDGTKAVFRWMP